LADSPGSSGRRALFMLKFDVRNPGNRTEVR